MTPQKELVCSDCGFVSELCCREKGIDAMRKEVLESIETIQRLIEHHDTCTDKEGCVAIRDRAIRREKHRIKKAKP